MCEQCMAKTKMVSKNHILGKWWLVRATQDGSYMKKGQYGLVRCNDPDFVFDGPIEADPTVGMPDKKISSLSKKDNKQWIKFSRWEDNIRDSFDTSVEIGYEFYTALKKKGYRPKRDGFNAIYWFLRHLSLFIKQARG